MAANNGPIEEGKKPLTAEEGEEEDAKSTDPIPERVQAWMTLAGMLAMFLLLMGIVSSEWVSAAEGFYWQGLFVYCINPTFNETITGDVKESAATNGCKRIDLDTQAYTMGVAMLVTVALAACSFSFVLCILGLWVRDLDSKIKSFRLAFYLMAASLFSLAMGLIVYRSCFADVMHDGEDLGPFKEPDGDWEFGWSYIVCCIAAFCIAFAEITIAYALCVMPIPEPEPEEGAAEGEEKE